MYGAIIGDICASIYEWHNCKTDKPEELLDFANSKITPKMKTVVASFYENDVR
ncbi:MAG: hypothetical protein LBT89_02590 [Planctomycetaceae bacterium]|jgi:hypothetical protein|nr:hypothetical protein [Planctomycetaceae bacterium]